MNEDLKTFAPLDRVRERVSQEKADSDVAFFYSLLFYGEFMTKLLVAALVATIQDDKDRTRYALSYSLVRANSVGDWASVLDNIALGPAGQYVYPDARYLHTDVTKKFGHGWVVDALQDLLASMDALSIEYDKPPPKPTVREWFRRFCVLRNKTRGHGATRSAQCADACTYLSASIDRIADNLLAFKASWAHLHKNLSGKYRVTVIGGKAHAFTALRSQTDLLHVPNGIYLEFDRPLPVELVLSDADLSDFYVPNGQFSNDQYDCLSYITNNRRRVSGSQYLTPATDLPPSATQGLGQFEVVGGTFVNLPRAPQNYVHRERLQEKLREQLDLARHPIVTLHGPGGIGKTTLALQVIYDMLAESTRFEVVVWFSARDIDLHESGPRPVRPHVVTKRDFANELVGLTHGDRLPMKSSDAIDYLGRALSNGVADCPTLFVFDNFETVDTPTEFFRWVDTYSREPNKILITTRMRSFTGDFPVRVKGLDSDESGVLIDEESQRLKIAPLLTKAYRAELARESDGHPYVIKVLLGEVAQRGAATKPGRIVAGAEDILTALFERTFVALSPAAQRVFLLLANWRSVVPELAIELVILRSAHERIDVSEALMELERMSFIEEVTSEEDKEVFVSVPLVAMLFGKRKLSASPLRAVIDVDTELLQAFGAGRSGDVKHGALPRIRKLLAHLAERIATRKIAVEDAKDVLEFIGRRVPAAWLEVARLYEEVQPYASTAMIKDALRRYLESAAGGDAATVWMRLANLCKGDGDYSGEIHALVEVCQVKGAALDEISGAANRINGVCAEIRAKGLAVLGSDERRGLLNRAAKRLVAHRTQLDATDCSRLAWLYVQMGETEQALAYATRGFELEPENYHCVGLMERLG